jgi:hypothetical protein
MLDIRDVRDVVRDVRALRSHLSKAVAVAVAVVRDVRH